MRTALLIIILTSGLGLRAQTYFSLNYLPGVATNIPATGLNFVFSNIGGVLGTSFPDSNLGVEGGAYFFNRGSGARVGVYDQNGAFVRWERSSENAYHLHVPVLITLKQENFYLKGGVSIDKFLFYKKKRAGILISDVPPIWADNLRLGLHIDAGITQMLGTGSSYNLGVYMSNTLGGNSTTPISFLNFGLSLSYNIFLSEVEEPEEDEFE